MGKIGDLFIKLGLKTEDLDKGLSKAGGSVKRFAALFGVISSAASGVFRAIADNAKQLAESIIRSSQNLSDGWDRSMSKMRAAWHEFTTTLTNWDWQGFGQRMRNAMNSAATAYDAQDALMEMDNSIRLRKAQMQEELSILQIQMRNEKLSYEQRKQAAEDYLAKVKPLYDDEIRARKAYAEASMGEFLKVLKMDDTASNRANVEDFVKNVANKPYVLQTLASTPKDMIVAGSTADIARRYQQNSSDDNVKKYVDATVAYYNAQASFYEENRRIWQQLNTNEARMEKAASTEQVDTKLQDAEKIAKRAEDAAKTEVQILRDKYNEEKSILEDNGMSTEALTKEFYSNLFDIQNEGLDKLVDKALELEPVEIEPIEIDQDFIDSLMDPLTELVERANELGQEFKQAVVDGFSAGCQELTDQLFGIKEINAGSVFQAILTPLANMAVKTGETIMAQGLAIETVKTSLLTLNGAAAVAAGAALIAAGSALKSGLSKIASGGSASTSSYTSTASSISSSGSPYRDESEIIVKVQGTLKGSDIVLAGEKALNRWSR